MSIESERRQAREVVSSYHEAQLAELVGRAADAIDSFRNGDLSAFEADHQLFQYSRAAKELWKFCNLSDVEMVASQVREGPPIDWWDRGAPRPRPARS